MKGQNRMINWTVREVRAELAHSTADERGRVIVGRSSLTVTAHRLQAAAAARGMTEQIHKDLLNSLKNDG